MKVELTSWLISFTTNATQVIFMCFSKQVKNKRQNANNCKRKLLL